jgi:3-(3-hydroxy-phenyl)propionate hydroxylase
MLGRASSNGRRPDGLTFVETQELNLPVDGRRGPILPRAQVIIVGAGPIGLLAANLLGVEGVEVLLLEKNGTTSSSPKAIVVDDEHLRVLDSLGLQDAVDTNAPPFGIHFFTAAGEPIVQAFGFVTPNGRGNRNPISQPVYEKRLLEGAQNYPTVSVRYGAEMIGLEQGADGVKLFVKCIDGSQQTVAADVLLACDGTNSVVREALGISFKGRRIDQPHLVIDLADFPDQSPYSRFFCDPARPFNSVPGPYGGRRIEFMLMPGDDPEKICTPEAVRELIDRHTPYAGMPVHLLRAAVYGFSGRVAERLFEGRIFLLGDAAHVMPPFGAQGLNTGARDAVNLCWKIKGFLNRTWSLSVLKTYESERRAQIEQTIAYSVRVGQLANIQSRPLAKLRNIVFKLLNRHPSVRAYFSQMRYMPKQRIGHGILIWDDHGKNSFVGMSFPRVGGLGPAKDQNFDQIVGRDFALVGIAAPRALLKVVSDLALWKRLGAKIIALEQLPADSAVEDAMSARIRQLHGVHCGEILVVRPDKYVAAAMTFENYTLKSAEFEKLLSLEPAR